MTHPALQTYLVGGAVRDQLLQRPVTERDYVVVGSTPEAMLALGFKPVGKDFPVFLHPDTHEEYALARTEKKVARGYQGFEFYTSPEVTLEQDLARRDLTINAIAQDADGHLIDPYGGVDDINQRCFRHVSPAFAEDPVRILRLARFAARFAEFKVHATTLTLMQTMVANGEVDALVPERVFQELNKALTEAAPLRFFQVLADCHALGSVLPELTVDKIDAAALTQASSLQDASISFAIITNQLNITSLKALCRRIRAPKAYAELARLSLQTQPYLHQLSHTAMLDLLQTADAWRRPERFAQLLTVLTLLTGNEAVEQQLTQALTAAKAINVSELVAQGLQGKALATAIRQARLQAISNINSSL